VNDGKVARGDWQTPPALAAAVIDGLLVGSLAGGLVGSLEPPRTIVEATCGTGAFLVAAGARLPRAMLLGWDIDAAYVRAARRALRGASRSRVEVADFFAVPWEAALAGVEEPILVVGNPPWVTSAQLGVIGSANAPPKRNDAGLPGLDARTGKSNFDVSEWMLIRLLEALAGRDATLAVLCKSAVARKVIETASRRGLGLAPGGLWRIDAREHFDAAVDAVLFVARTKSAKYTHKADPGIWPVHASLGATASEASLVVVDGVLLADARAFARTRHLAGTCEPEWRSGLKHDCARVMELERGAAGGWTNGLGEQVDIEADVIHPLLKSSDVANDRGAPTRAVIVPQRALGEDTSALRRCAPRAWKYLSRHRALLDARKSSIYEGQPPFAIFGVGPYSFAPWKVAVSGLYKRSAFALVGPHEGRPVVLDDTCYFLAFADERGARRAATALQSELARDFLSARIFWDAKRPINKAILQSLDLAALESALTGTGGR
jgi:hypothetical protein